MKYRLNYDKCFIAAHSEKDALEVDGHKIMDIAIYFEYRVFDKDTGEELFFTAEKISDDSFDMEQYIDGYPLNDFFRCEYDKNSSTGYIMKPTAVNKKSKYRVEYEICDCYWYGFELDCEQISYEKFCDLLLTYPDYFDTTTNKPCQSGAFGWRKVID